jgi:hypothetical protein
MQMKAKRKSDATISNCSTDKRMKETYHSAMAANTKKACRALKKSGLLVCRYRW